MAQSSAQAATIALTPAALKPGRPARLTGTGFGARRAGTVRVGARRALRFRTDAAGRFAATLRTPARSRAGRRTLIVRAGRRRVATTVTVTRAVSPSSALGARSSGERLVVTPTAALPGARLALRGAHFGRRRAVELRLGTTRLRAVRADRRGDFAAATRVPAVEPGAYALTARWRGRRLALRFVVTRAPAPAVPAPPASAGAGTGAGAAPPVVVAAAGDIACDPQAANFNGGLGTATRCHMAATSRVAAAAGPAGVLALGDTQYVAGTLAAYAGSWRPSWGRFDAIVHPVPGDEEYESPGAGGYFAYFGARAGAPGAGYYSFDLGEWHLIALNSECDVVPCASGSAQEAFLRADLAAHPAPCTLAYMHRSRFTSGPAAPAIQVDPFWRDLYAARADVVLGAHAHQYERFAPQTPDGVADPATGIRQFVAGTGGHSLAAFMAVPRLNSEARVSAFGVLVLTLRSRGYDWQFVNEAGVVVDAGSGICH
jgi:acid phosphatase type 7